MNLKLILLHNKRAAEIFRQIGHVEFQRVALSNLVGSYIENGEFRNIKDVLREFSHGFPDAEQLAGEVLSNITPELLLARGDWLSALKVFREKLIKARDVGDLQDIAENNLGLTNVLLELNRFSNLEDLSEGENALNENIDNGYRVRKSLYLLSNLCIRMSQFSQAKDWMSRAEDFVSKSETNYSKSQFSDIQFELAFVKGLWAEAMAACDKSIEIYQTNGYRWKWARMLIDLGDALAGRNEPGDLERVIETYQQSLDMFTEMGAPGYIKVLKERLENL